ncbi:MAG: hypothetical protein RI956_684 [Pseudomonadota bacterium]
MKLFLNLRKIILLSIAAAGLSACVVVPSDVEVNQPQVPTPPTPYYVAPNNGYVWMLHPKKGWGWYHKKESHRHRKHH